MIIEILTIGDELLSGDILDTNKQYLSSSCWDKGFKVEFHTGVRDDDAAIQEALLKAAERADVVLCTGGLGPTVDDFTIEVAAKTFDTELVWDEASLKYLTEWYQTRNIPIEENNRKLALIPKGGKALSNKYGTAPGVYYAFKKTDYYFMPGVPKEMKFIFEEHVFPQMLKKTKPDTHFVTAFLKTFGSTESELDRQLKDLTHDRLHIQNARIGFRFSFPEISLKVSVWDKNPNKAKKDLEKVVSLIKERVGKYIYSENKDETLEEAVVKKLIAKKKTVSVAESCTGGLLASRITSVSGASKVFLGGVVSYSNEMKESLLAVDSKILKDHGAVSSQCAEAMVRSIQKITKSDFAAAVTGVAGPTGGTKDKPIGTVHIATLCDGRLINKEYHFGYSREMFRVLVGSVVLRRFLIAS